MATIFLRAPHICMPLLVTPPTLQLFSSLLLLPIVLFVILPRHHSPTITIEKHNCGKFSQSFHHYSAQCNCLWHFYVHFLSWEMHLPLSLEDIICVVRSTKPFFFVFKYEKLQALRKIGCHPSSHRGRRAVDQENITAVFFPFKCAIWSFQQRKGGFILN